MTFRFIHLIWAYHQVYIVQTLSNSNFMLCIYYEDFYRPVIYDASPTFIAMFYYTLGNLSPKYRSLLRAIQLACVAPVSVVNKYGVDAVLAPVVQQLKKLEQVINYYYFTRSFKI